MTTRTTYAATAVRDGDGWLVRCPDVPGAHAAARTLEKAPDAIRDVLVLQTGADRDSFDVTVTAKLGAAMGRSVLAVHATRRSAADAAAIASATIRGVVRELDAHGIGSRDIAHLLGISHQRVGQLMRERPPVVHAFGRGPSNTTED
jgi:predicted RNase H-like HicB family nuclease